MAMISGMQQLGTTGENLSAIDCPVWGLACGGDESSSRVIAWFCDFNDAQIAQHAIVQAGGTAIPPNPPELSHAANTSIILEGPSLESDERLDTPQL